MITAIAIPVDINEPIRQTHLNNSHIDVYRRVAGRDLGAILLDRPPATLYYNDKDHPAAPRPNHRATALLWVHNSVFRGREVVVGPAFVVGPPDYEDNHTSAPTDLIDLLLNTAHYRVQLLPMGSSRWANDSAVFTDWVQAYRHALRLWRAWPIIEEVRVVPEPTPESD